MIVRLVLGHRIACLCAWKLCGDGRERRYCSLDVLLITSISVTKYRMVLTYLRASFEPRRLKYVYQELHCGCNIMPSRVICGQRWKWKLLLQEKIRLLQT